MRLMVAAVVAFALVLAGCGQTSQADRMKAVVRAMNADVNAGRFVAAARLLSLPVRISFIGPEAQDGCYCRTAADLAHLNAQLPCSATIMSITVRGRNATAVLGLHDKPTSTCDAPPGSRTAVQFTIVHGKITASKQLWVQPSGGAPISGG